MKLVCAERFGDRMARKKKIGKKYDNSLIGLLLIVCLLIGLFFYYGLPRDDQSDDLETELPTGINQTFQETFIQQIVPKTKEIQEEYQILPSIIMAQAILESNWGRSDLSVNENNYFGIKDTEKGAVYATQEYTDEWIVMDEPFKIYDSFEDSMEDHARLLANGPDWDENLYQSVIEANDYQTAAFALQEAGYATDPTYANKLIEIIERYELYQYDN